MLRLTRHCLPVPQPVFDVNKLPGITDPLGFFDPAGFTEGASEGKVRFYREVELKHGRVAMLAAVGFLVAEQFHPLWGGNIDVPSYIAFQETPLQPFWPAVVFLIAVPEVFSVFTFQSPFGGETWAINSEHEAGDFGFDPAGLKPSNDRELLGMQNAELNNGRAPRRLQPTPPHAVRRARSESCSPACSHADSTPPPGSLACPTFSPSAWQALRCSLPLA